MPKNVCKHERAIKETICELQFAVDELPINTLPHQFHAPSGLFSFASVQPVLGSGPECNQRPHGGGGGARAAVILDQQQTSVPAAAITKTFAASFVHGWNTRGHDFRVKRVLLPQACLCQASGLDCLRCEAHAVAFGKKMMLQLPNLWAQGNDSCSCFLLHVACVCAGLREGAVPAESIERGSGNAEATQGCALQNGMQRRKLQGAVQTPSGGPVNFCCRPAFSVFGKAC